MGPPRQDEIHAPFLLASLLLAMLGGFVLGAYIPWQGF
jgi:hypothetical protein